MRRWFQLHLRTIALLAVALSIPLAWLTNSHRAAGADEAAVAQLGIERVLWQRQHNRWFARKWSLAWFLCPTSPMDSVTVRTAQPNCLAELAEGLGLGRFQRIIEVHFDDKTVDHSRLQTVAKFKYLRSVSSTRCKVSQSAVEQFSKARPDVRVFFPATINEQIP